MVVIFSFECRTMRQSAFWWWNTLFYQSSSYVVQTICQRLRASSAPKFWALGSQLCFQSRLFGSDYAPMHGSRLFRSLVDPRPLESSSFPALSFRFFSQFRLFSVSHFFWLFRFRLQAPKISIAQPLYVTASAKTFSPK